MLKSKCAFIRISIALILSLFSVAISRADQGVDAVTQATKPACLKNVSSVEFLTGYGLAKLRDQGSYKIIPFFVDFNFDLKPILPKKVSNYPGMLQFSLEPFANHIFEPDNNVEIGTNFLIKVGLAPETWKLQPYLRGGLGMLYLSQHTREQGAQFNFNEYVGFGLHYFLKKNLALTLEYRYRHLSNAGIDEPNKGINTNFTLCGLAYSF